MKEDFRLNNNIQVAMLPTIGEYCPFGEPLIVSGWGAEREPSRERRGRPPRSAAFNPIRHRFLWAVKQKCIDTAQCTNNYWDKDSIICAEGQKDIRDSVCHGDSGGNVF